MCMYTRVFFLWPTNFAEQPEILTRGGASSLVSLRDESVVVAFVIGRAVPPVTREQVNWTFTSSIGRATLPCANTSEYTFSEDCLSLRILRVAHRHGGKYELFARTRAGMDTKSVTLVVTGGKGRCMWTYFSSQFCHRLSINFNQNLSALYLQFHLKYWHHCEILQFPLVRI